MAAFFQEKSTIRLLEDTFTHESSLKTSKMITPQQAADFQLRIGPHRYYSFTVRFYSLIFMSLLY
jgi:hypothetical protein